MSRVTQRVRGRGDTGAILVYVALLIPVLFAAAAIAVDIARWYVEVQRVQRAADAAALAAAPYVPGPITAGSEAYEAAAALVAANGFSAGANNMALSNEGLTPTQVRVTLDSEVSNGFGSLLGVPTTTILRSAVGEFNGPAPLGSPCNVHGNEPLSDLDDTVLPAGMTNIEDDPCAPWPQFWPTIYGPEVYKTQGDQFATRKCGIDPYRESNCVSGSRGSASEDFDPRGYAITIKVRQRLSNALTIQLYDAAYVDTGSTCDAIPGIGTNSPNSYVNDAFERYAPNSDPLSGGRPSFCTGDSDNQGLRFGNEVPTVTSFGLIRPTRTFNPFDDAANEEQNRVVGCYQQYPGFGKDGGGNGAWSTPQSGYGTPIGGGTATQQLSRTTRFTELFHRWVTLCQIPGPVAPGDYYLRVRTNVAWGASADTFFGFADNAGVQGNGGNRFSVRAFTSDSADATSVSVSPYARMPIFANTNESTTVFNLVRVPPESAGANINFTFFDVGDATSDTGGSGTLTVLPPIGADVPMDLNTACTVSGSLYGNPPTTTSNTSCEVSGIRNNRGFNGQEWKIIIPVPSDYDCDGDDPYACWWRLRVQFTNTDSVTDQTTWTATLDGDPVRLVE